eukprot:5003694-Pyramimonas_sp.AAC.1
MRPQVPRGQMGSGGGGAHGGGAHGHFTAFPSFEPQRCSSSGSFWDRMPSRAPAMRSGRHAVPE